MQDQEVNHKKQYSHIVLVARVHGLAIVTRRPRCSSLRWDVLSGCVRSAWPLSCGCFRLCISCPGLCVVGIVLDLAFVDLHRLITLYLIIIIIDIIIAINRFQIAEVSCIRVAWRAIE